MNKQFNHFECNNESENSFWYVEELNEWHLYQDKYQGYTMSTGKKCKSKRAFFRHLKNMARKQPELKGIQFRLCSLWYEVSKKGNRKSLDIIGEVK